MRRLDNADFLQNLHSISAKPLNNSRFLEYHGCAMVIIHVLNTLFWFLKSLNVRIACKLKTIFTHLSICHQKMFARPLICLCVFYIELGRSPTLSRSSSYSTSFRPSVFLVRIFRVIPALFPYPRGAICQRYFQVLQVGH